MPLTVGAMGEVAEEDEEAGGRVPLEPPERLLLRLLLERWLVLEAGGRALDRLVVLAAERAVVVAAAAGAAGLGLVELDFREAGFWEVGGGVVAWLVGAAAGAGLALALLASPAPSEAADLPVDRVVGVAMAGRGGTGTG